MKIRSDHVTNSSSSSFVIAYRKPEDKYHNAVLELFLDSEGDYESTCAARVHSIQDLNDYYLKNMNWFEDKDIEAILKRDDCFRQTYDKAKAALQDGYTVAFKDISYHNETLISFAVFLETSGDITILERDE